MNDPTDRDEFTICELKSRRYFAMPQQTTHCPSDLSPCVAQVIVESIFAVIAVINASSQRAITVKYDINIDIAAKLEYETI